MTGGVFTDKVNGRLYAFVKSSDVLSLLNKGAADCGFMGSDKLYEEQFGGRFWNMGKQIVASASCALVLASENQNVGFCPRVVTSYPNLAKQAFGDWRMRQRYRPEIVFEPSGSVEAYTALGLADAIVDIRESGQTLEDNGFGYYEELQDIYTMLVFREEAEEPELDLNVISKAVRAISERKRQADQKVDTGDSVTGLMLRDRNELVKKLGSEAAELVQEVVLGSTEGLVGESQDVIYAVAVALAAQDKSLVEALNEL